MARRTYWLWTADALATDVAVAAADAATVTIMAVLPLPMSRLLPRELHFVLLPTDLLHEQLLRVLSALLKTSNDNNNNNNNNKSNALNYTECELRSSTGQLAQLSPNQVIKTECY
jgi:hypothetical protein